MDDYSEWIDTKGQVTVGGSATGNAEVTDDEDWFRVSLVAGTAYVFKEQGASSGHGTLHETFLTLYDSGGNEIAHNRDFNGGLESQIAFRPTSSGDYYLGASAASSYPNFYTGTYTVSASKITGGEPTGTPVIFGVAQRGQGLTVNTSNINDPDGLGDFHFHWQNSADNGVTWTNIAGDQSVYFPAAADVGDLLRVQASYKDGQGLQESVTSAPTSKIVDASLSGFHINLIPDVSVAHAPAGFTAAVRAAADIYQRLFSDNITLNIRYGWGTLNNFDNNSIPNGGVSYSFGEYGISYSDLKNWLSNDRVKTPDDLAAISSLPADQSGHFFVSDAQLKALGHYTGDGRDIDGAIDLGTASTPSYWLALALHEIGHSLGRVSKPTQGQPTIFDLFRYDAAGHFQWTEFAPAYFSLDGGHTKLADFAVMYTSSDFKTGGVQGSDLFNERVANLSTLTAVDLRTMDALGFDLAAYTPKPPAVKSALKTDTGPSASGSSNPLSPARRDFPRLIALEFRRYLGILFMPVRLGPTFSRTLRHC